jgi:hypothetical protein
MMKLINKSFENVEPTTNLERRRKPRIYDPVFVVVRGSDSCARNIGSGGLCAYTPQIMKTGEKLRIHIRFARAGSKPLEAPAIAARAVVLRVEKQFNGLYLFAASFLLHRFV